MALKIKCAACGEGDGKKGLVLIYPSGNYHEICKKEKFSACA